ncbi:MAG: phosphate ABC transporter substrate-binding protein PstS [Thermoproteota archaeon]
MNQEIRITIVVTTMIALLGSIIFLVNQYLIKPQGNTEATREISLNGAGATFPFPLIDKWIAEYHKIKSNVKINYQSIGSGAGIRQHTEKIVHFAGSDAPLTEKQRANATNTLHIPETIGGVIIIYNIPGLGKGLKLTGEVLADIYLGEITKWNDPKIAALNPDASLPEREIIVARRADSSGTTFVFTDYLEEVSEEWRNTVGKGTTVNWPTGLGGKGNEGVAGLVSQNPYSIGYVEFIYAKRNNLTWAYLKNAVGEFVVPGLDSFSIAASYAASNLPKGDESWSQVSIVDSIVNNREAKGAYPITSLTYILVYKELSVLPDTDEDTARTLVEFLWWIIHDGQRYSAELDYVPLPENVVRLNEETIKMITFNGKQLYTG